MPIAQGRRARQPLWPPRVGQPASNERICLVGPGWRFTSGISYYTCRLAHAIAEQHSASVVQLRQLLPVHLYPGRRHVGKSTSRMSYPASVPVYDGIDWWWGRSLAGALRFMRAYRPRVLVLEWWTAVTLHTYVVLAIAARLLGARVVIELHELQDPGEAGLAVARGYARWGLRLLLRLSHGCVVHSAADRRSLEARYHLGTKRVAVAAHGPYDQFNPDVRANYSDDAGIAAVQRAPRPAVRNLLFFGLIRKYKGVEDLLSAFNSFTKAEVAGLWLTIVGETWDATSVVKLINESPYSDRITFIDEYVPDEVVAAAFRHADAVILPYRRSASSGTLHIAMSWGLPVVLTSVGGLPESASGYRGAIFVSPGDSPMLKAAIKQAAQMAGQRFPDPRNWSDTLAALLSAAHVSDANVSRLGSRPSGDYAGQGIR